MSSNLWRSCTPNAATRAPSAPQHILVADDSEGNRTLLRRLLTRCGYDVTEVKDGVETLKAVERDAPDLILRPALPELDGEEALRELRRSYDSHVLPIIIVTAEHDSNVAIDCLEAGANDFVTKPFAWPVLRARIKTFKREERQRKLAAALMIGAMSAVSAEPAIAQEMQRVSADERLEFDIAAQPLSSAWSEFARQARVNALYLSDDLLLPVATRFVHAREGACPSPGPLGL